MMNYTLIATIDLVWAFDNGVSVDDAVEWSEKYHPTKYFCAHASRPSESEACWEVSLPLLCNNKGDHRATSDKQLKTWLDASAPYIKLRHYTL